MEAYSPKRISRRYDLPTSLQENPGVIDQIRAYLQHQHEGSKVINGADGRPESLIIKFINEHQEGIARTGIGNVLRRSGIDEPVNFSQEAAVCA